MFGCTRFVVIRRRPGNPAYQRPMIATRTMTDVDPPFSGGDSLLSDEPTIELVLKAHEPKIH